MQRNRIRFTSGKNLLVLTGFVTGGMRRLFNGLQCLIDLLLSARGSHARSSVSKAPNMTTFIIIRERKSTIDKSKRGQKERARERERETHNNKVDPEGNLGAGARERERERTRARR